MYKGKIAVMDHTGHTTVVLDSMTDAEVRAEFHRLVTVNRMVLAAGATLDTLEQVRTEDEFLALAGDTDTETQFLARGQVVGG